MDANSSITDDLTAFVVALNRDFMLMQTRIAMLETEVARLRLAVGVAVHPAVVRDSLGGVRASAVFYDHTLTPDSLSRAGWQGR